MKHVRFACLLAAGAFLLSGCTPSSKDVNLTGSSGSNSDPGKPVGTSGSTGHTGPLKKLDITDVKVGDGGEFAIKAPAKTGDKVYMLYTGKLADGTVFDSNDKAGGNVFSFTVGEGEVIQGWDKGIPGMKIGGERKLSIPSAMAYGGTAKGQIPANSDLYFDVKLLDIVPPGKENVILYDDVKKGTGPLIKAGDKVTVHYKITDLYGNEIQSDEDGKGVTFAYKKNEAMPNLESGMEGMRQGGVRNLRMGPAVSLPAKGPMMSGPSIQLIHLELVKVAS